MSRRAGWRICSSPAVCAAISSMPGWASGKRSARVVSPRASSSFVITWWSWAMRLARSVGIDGSLHEAALCGPAGELVPAGQLELAEHRRDVGLDGLHRQVEAAGHLLVRVPPGDERQDIPFASGELVG